MKKLSNKDGIAPWKIDSFFERWLAKKADNSRFWRSMYVNFYKVFDNSDFEIINCLFMPEFIDLNLKNCRNFN